ncbi:MAG: TetR/AcrR family transcriptional regulator [Alphaproteobacteria bacterium]|jgi:AcrR family transcriptional regulator|nr:TetR/AcrR family transcriptional regulator [Alphaproteobacteria bacterium]
MAKTKEEIRVDLIVKAREILKDKGFDFLTARKLSEYSGYSVGTIYNQFKSMDNLVMWENCLTLDELNEYLKKAEMSSDAYVNLNRLVEKFVDFVLENKNLWFTLYNFHFKDIMDDYAVFYLRRIVKIIQVLENNLCKLFVKVPGGERKVSTEVLFITLFALSSLLTTEKEFVRLNKKYVVKVMFNTYLAGISMLAKG